MGRTALILLDQNSSDRVGAKAVPPIGSPNVPLSRRVRGDAAARGAAIVMAMLLAAFAATIAATLLWQQQRWITEHEHRRDQVQAQALAMAGVQWARQILYDNLRGSVAVHLGQPWAFRLPPTPIEHGSIGGYIVDAQSRLNVNNLAARDNAAASMRAALQRLFGQVGVPISFASAITDWVDADDVTSDSGGAEDTFYLAQSIPGLAANTAITRIAELLQVRGANPVAFARLRPYVEAIDTPVPINVNTAPAEVLIAAINGLDAAGAAAILAARDKTPFGSVAEFRSRLPRPNLVVDEALLDVKSAWFVVSIEARQGDTLARARALLKRSSTEWPAIVWQIVE